jgi:hypothetical protein
MNTDALKAGLVATTSQVVALLVSYGIVDNQHAGQWISLTIAIVNAAFLIAHALHSKEKKP